MTPSQAKRARLAALLRAAAHTASDPPECLHRRFAAQAARTPEAIALTCGDRHWTYRELDAHAGHLARRLRGLGVGPEVLVGLCAERSAELVVGLLAILEAGGAYVPLDPVHPAERLGFQLEDCGAPVLLAQPHLADRLPAHSVRVVDLESIDAAGPPEDGARIDSGTTPDNLAYVIYTSGSTGMPKGVPVTHANVARLFTATRHWFQFGATDVWTLFHSFAFDFSVWEIWGALLHGGRLVVVPYWVGRSPESFYELLRREGVTVLNQTPSAFRQLVRVDESAGAGDLALRWVIFGGEALELQALRPWFDRHGDTAPRLVNMYGITETTVHVTYRPIARGDLETFRGSSPIGRALPDLRLYVLDRHREPVPPGAVGEAFVGGAGVARGYLGRPGLTADRFVPDPFSGQPGARLYRSGDLVRLRRDGELEYIGRSDRQVKIRGFRIELGEIEAALARQPELHEAVVVARTDPRGEARLVAYLVPRRRPAPAPAELRQRLQGSLPDYMVPALYVVLDSMPLTPNGKLDVDALPPPEWGRATGSLAEFVPPRSPTEELIAATWAEVLGVDRVGALDDFFAMGGHSLLAAQAVSRLRHALAVEFPLRALFEAPTVAALADRIEVARREGRRRFVAPIVPVPRDGELPLSFAQQALWFLDRLTPQAPTFNVPAAVRITGPLDVPALERSFHEILRRHEALRTAFPAADGRPVPVIAPSLAPPLTPVDLSTLDEAERTECARRLAVEESRRPFDLAAGPLIRAQVLRLDDQEHVILLTMHHIITDGWSMGVAARELAALYEAYTTGSASPLAELPIQYADYAAWQRAYLQGEVLAGLLAYWSERLAGLNPLELPTDRPRPAVRSGRGDVRFFDLSPELAAGLRDLSRREGATLFMTLLAGFQALLSRYSGQDDIAVGVPVANRNRPEVEDLIGYFVNMLVLRTDLSDDPTFGALVQRVRETTLGAFEHQELPFDQLVQALQPVRDPSRTPLFDVMFVLQNNRMPDASRQELTLGHLEVGEGTRTAKFDLTLCIVEGDERLFGSIEYNTDLFDGSTIERLIGHFRTLLATVVAQPGRRVSEAALLDEAERLRLVEEWNQTAADLPEEGCLHRLVEAQARRTPEAVALVHNGRTWSYRELNARANRLARWLRSRGVGPEVRVGLFLDRSVEAALGLLGILKAGGAYVPFEPSEPERRLAGMLEDADVALVLTRTSLRDRLPARRAEVLCLDSDRERFGREPDHDLEGGAGPENAAYVIFTSGSTGPPRGVIVSHRSVVNHCIASARMFALGPGDRVLQFAPLNFDIAVEEIFPAWCTGSAVVLRDGDELLDPTRFTDWIERERITVVDLPTGYWHAWVDRLAQLGRSPAGSLRLVVVGGEKAIPAAYATWRRLAGDRIRWLNTYGPTEATVIATAYEPPAGAEDLAELPIGRPIANARVYVLDGWLQPVPIGLPGELCIGGLGVSRGYRDHAAQTAERFLPDPFTTEPGARLFRTGDLVRWRPDGQLVFVGRVDFQAKIRGFRVEPGEVEAALLEQPGVRAAKVVARAGVEGSARLDAYLVLEPGATAAPGAYRSRLRDRLPGHMVPSSFTALEALPLTPSGKVDLRALPDPGRGAVGSEGFVAPRDEVEARLAAIWEDLLAIRPVGVTDSFFDLGGHSLLAIRMLTRVEAAFGRALPLSSVFLGAAIADLAEMLRRPVEPRAATPLVALQPAGASRPFFCVHPAGGIAYCFLELAQSLGADRPFYAFQAPGLEGDAEPFDSLERMAAHYIDAMRTVQPAGPYHLGGWSLGGLVAYEMARQLTAQGQPVATLAVLDAHAPSPPPEPTPALRRLAEQAVSLPLFRDSLAFGDGDAGVDDVALLLGFLAPMAPGVGLGSRRLFDRLNRLSPDEQRLEALKFFGLDQVYHRETEPERVARLWKVLGTNLLAALKYTPRPYPGRLVLLRAAANSDADADPAMGWGELAAAVATHTIPGDHAAILRPPGVAILAGALIAEIARCEASWDGRHGRIQPLR